MPLVCPPQTSQAGPSGCRLSEVAAACSGHAALGGCPGQKGAWGGGPIVTVCAGPPSSAFCHGSALAPGFVQEGGKAAQLCS